jgi:hypothetical protein
MSSPSGKREVVFIHHPLSVFCFCCQLKTQLKARLVWVTAVPASASGRFLAPVGLLGIRKWVPFGWVLNVQGWGFEPTCSIIC